MATPSNPPPYPHPSRPLGVAILAVLVGIFGLLWILGGLLILANVTAVAYFNGGGLPHLLHAVGIVAGLIVLILGLIVLGLAVGLWHLRMWALVLTLLVLIVELASYGIARDLASLGFIVSLILFVYLLAVHRHFD
ncbi:MAG: hypothetical protein WAK40_03870 [Thermoplasmata archaeon]